MVFYMCIVHHDIYTLFFTHTHTQYSDSQFFVEGHLLDLLRVPMGACVIPQAKYILARSIVCVINGLAVFPVYTALTL